MTRQLLHNSIKCPDGTILVSKHGHDFVQHEQEDGRVYFVDGGLSYQRLGFADTEYIDLSVYSDAPHEDIRNCFTWTKSFDGDMNPLTKPEQVLLKDITESHLEALVKWTETGYPDYINDVFKNETKWRAINVKTK